MIVITRIIAILFAISALTACQGQGVNKQTGGTLIGGLAGGILGSQVGGGEGKLIATGIGAVAGALVGGSIGQTLDQYDQQMMQRTSQQALEHSMSGKAVTWKNPDSGHSGSITPQRAFKNDEGQVCREYTQEVVIGGERQKAYGKACRQYDGNWKIVQ